MEQLVKSIMLLFMGLNLFNFIGLMAYEPLTVPQRGAILLVVGFIGTYFCHALDRLYHYHYDWSIVTEWWDSIKFNVAVVACAAAAFIFILWASTTRLM